MSQGQLGFGFLEEGDLDQFLGIKVNSKIDGSIFIHQTVSALIPSSI